MPRTVVAAIVLACCSLTVSGQQVRPDTVLVLKSGQEVRGQFVGFKNGLFTLRLPDGRITIHGVGDVDRMQPATEAPASVPAPPRPPVAAPPPQAPAAVAAPAAAPAAPAATPATPGHPLRPRPRLPPRQQPPRRRPRLPAPISRPRHVGRQTKSTRPSPTRPSIPLPQLLQTRGSSISCGRAIRGAGFRRAWASTVGGWVRTTATITSSFASIRASITSVRRARIAARWP